MSEEKTQLVTVVCPKCKTSREVCQNHAVYGLAGRACHGCAKKTHGESRTKLYRIWAGMLTRAGIYRSNNPRQQSYRRRGISLHDEGWRDYSVFAEWARASGYAEGMTLDRRNNDSGYSPENCRWVSAKMNARNRSTARFRNEDILEICRRLTAGEKGISIAADYGVSRGSIYDIKNDRRWADVR